MNLGRCDDEEGGVLFGQEDGVVVGEVDSRVGLVSVVSKICWKLLVLQFYGYE